MTLIRPVAKADATDWLQIRQALWPDGDLAEHQRDIDRYFSGDRREPSEVLLAFATNGALAGFAELSFRNIVDGCASDRVAYLEGWYVVPAARRMGIGRALIQAAEEWGVRQGCTEFGSDSLIDNDVSFAAHLGSGFVETGVVRTYRKDIRRPRESAI